MKEYIVTVADGSTVYGGTELIRCKDCVYFSLFASHEKENGLGSCHAEARIIRENDFCSWAERRGEE